ncbi:MAG: GNAT family N-acetyltransferase [Betaproteobacteria bacterium]|nr:GNAT family N-acetyltransferase [Betaproteobacteria bacterium]
MLPRGDDEIARTIAALHAESWRAAYRGLYSDRFLDTEVHDERRQFWASRVARLHRLDAELFLATLEGTPAGFACIESGPQCTHGAYIDNLHVLPAFQRVGIGVALVRAAAAWARLRGHPSIYLFVFEGNARARAFYSATGWREAGRDLHVMVTGESAPVLRMIKAI